MKTSQTMWRPKCMQKWPSRVCTLEVRLWSKAAAVGEPQRKQWGGKKINKKRHKAFSVCKWNHAPSFCTFCKATGERGTHHVSQQDSAPTQSTHADQSVKRGFCTCTHSARLQWKDQALQNVLSILFLVAFVMQRVKEQEENHQPLPSEVCSAYQQLLRRLLCFYAQLQIVSFAFITENKSVF